MDEQIVKQELNIAPLDKQTTEIAQQILDEQDVDKVRDLTALFNLNSQKRNVARVLKMNKLLDTVTDSVIERFEKTPGNFSNEDLIKYMQVTEQAIEKANKQLNLVEDTPAIQINQNNQINVGVVDALDKDSRDRVAEAIQKILARNSAIDIMNEDN